MLCSFPLTGTSITPYATLSGIIFPFNSISRPLTRVVDRSSRWVERRKRRAHGFLTTRSCRPIADRTHECWRYWSTTLPSSHSILISIWLNCDTNRHRGTSSIAVALAYHPGRLLNHTLLRAGPRCLGRVPLLAVVLRCVGMVLEGILLVLGPRWVDVHLGSGIPPRRGAVCIVSISSLRGRNLGQSSTI